MPESLAIHMALRRAQHSPLVAGVILGLGAAVLQAFFSVIPPVAYGVCMVCHPKDLVNWIAFQVFGIEWGYSIASVQYPLLTVVGIVIGATVAAWKHSELRFRPCRRPLRYFFGGFLAINFGLLVASCPIRLILLSAYGDVISLMEWAVFACGAIGATVALRYWARRAAASEDA
jgi:hypothetical protein